MVARNFSRTPPTRFRVAGRFWCIQLGVSGVEDTVRYIQMQEEHHRKKSFSEELEVFLKKHGYDYKAEMMD